MTHLGRTAFALSLTWLASWAGCATHGDRDDLAPRTAARVESPTDRARPGKTADGPPPRAGSQEPGERATSGEASVAVRPPTGDELARYPWLADDAAIRPLEQAIPAPEGFHRVALPADAFGTWLRGLPLRARGAPVRAYDGRVLHDGDDPRIAAVVEVDVSPVDLQQCADSVIRMHAEWKWSAGSRESIGYHFLSGDFASWPAYAAGDRPKVDGQHVRFERAAKASDDHATFRKYLDLVFMYASTISLAQRAEHVDAADVAPGDFVVLPGGPGHAILILDVATDASGHRLALLGQGYMPAQDFQVLHAASGNGNVGPWFSLDGDGLDTPFWPEPFPWSSLRRMR